MRFPEPGTAVVVTEATPCVWRDGRRGVVHEEQPQRELGRLYVHLDEPIRHDWIDVYADRWHLAPSEPES